MKKVYVRSLGFIVVVVIPAIVVWITFFKVPKMIEDNDEYKVCQAKCHPNIVEKFTPCVCDTRYKHGKDTPKNGK
jgi:hypothetical protein